MEDILNKAKSWMKDYMESFHSSDEQIMHGIMTKEIHTGYVTKYSKELAIHLGLSEHDVMLCELIGLFHDVGRFRQWTIYKTFFDCESEDHANLSVKVIVELPFYKELSPEDRKILEFAIGNHNKMHIAEGCTDRELGFTRIIRDADKLDIYRVLDPYLDEKNNSGFSKRENNLLMDDSYSPGFLERFMIGQQVDFNMINTLNDKKLVRLMWVYDVNYAWTLKRIEERGYIDKIISSLPKDEGTQKGIRVLKEHILNKYRQKDSFIF